jgi:hypothetical protein
MQMAWEVMVIYYKGRTASVVCGQSSWLITQRSWV